MLKGLRIGLPSPALVLSILALILALGGTALAAGSVSTAKKHRDAKQDRKLIKKMAKGLSVKHAKTAGSANTASHATTADTATNASHATTADTATNASHATTADTATNASQLNGYAASQLTRVASVAAPGDHSISVSGTTDIASTTLNVPVKSYVFVDASGYAIAQTAAGCPCVLQGHILQDGEALNNPVTLVTNTNLAGDAGDLVGGFDRRTFGGSRVIVADAGTHTYTFTIHRQTGTSTSIGASYVHLTAMLLPFGSTGTAPAVVTGGPHARTAPSAR